MYHSISNAPGPTSIPVDTFRGQVEALAECGYQALSLGGFMSWRSGKTEIASRSVVITFDDGFADFAESAFPILKSHGFTSSVFLPSGKMGGVEDWDEKPSRRRLMTWRQVADLSKENVEFGGHSVNHRDLTSLSESELKREVVECKERIAQEIGCAPVAFAPPFGKANARERQEIQNAFSLSVGTALNRADRA
jgi:peptidoglycan/xylan/chitin deacetylase (PgdA/CDA1 family)